MLTPKSLKSIIENAADLGILDYMFKDLIKEAERQGYSAKDIKNIINADVSFAQDDSTIKPEQEPFKEDVEDYSEEAEKDRQDLAEEAAKAAELFKQVKGLRSLVQGTVLALRYHALMPPVWIVKALQDAGITTPIEEFLGEEVDLDPLTGFLKKIEYSCNLYYKKALAQNF